VRAAAPVRALATIPPDLSITPMKREEADILAVWAADEGWNPGKSDIGVAWDTDPEGFIALRIGSDLVGGGTIMSYDGRFGFMGLFIVRRDQRGRGFGAHLWRYRLNRLQGRLAPEAPIGMDGVLAMKPFYERGGFMFAHNDVRYQGIAEGTMDPAVRPIDSSMFAIVESFDRLHVPAPRAPFLRRWTFQRGAHALGLHENGQMVGYGVARPALTGYKFGPVFAKRADIAERLILSLMACIPGEQVQLDVPEPNQSASRLAEKFGLKAVFGCARLYHGQTPDLPIGNIFGVTSFEFG
jgi:GNAT superfamily N-acetyltransferase